MGSSDNQQNATLANSIVSDSLQNVANYCSITCNDNISNLDLVIVGGTAEININQSCSIIGAECLMKTIMNSEIDNLVTNILNQSQTNSIFSFKGPASSETANITNSIKNQVTQLVHNTCFIGSENDISNTSVFAQDANLDFSIAQTGSVNKAQCVLDTVAKVLINNDITNDVKQKQISGNSLAVIIAIVIIIILIIIGPYLFELSQAAGRVIGGKNY